MAHGADRGVAICNTRVISIAAPYSTITFTKASCQSIQIAYTANCATREQQQRRRVVERLRRAPRQQQACRQPTAIVVRVQIAAPRPPAARC